MLSEFNQIDESQTGADQQCQDNLTRYGRTLLQHQPEATTELLIDLCSGNLGKKPTHVHPPQNGTQPEKSDGSGPAVLSYLGYNRVTGFLTGDNQSSTANGYGRTAKPSTDRQPTSRVAQGDTPDPEATDEMKEDVPSYDPPSPQRYFAHFLDHSVMFVHFLESIALSLWDQTVSTAPPARDTPLPVREEAPPSYDDDPVKADQRAVWNTLLELYLAASRTSDVDNAKQASDKALGLLADSDLPYDPMHALILCSSVDFKEGLVRLWESMGMYEDVLRFYMDKDRESAGRVDNRTDAKVNGNAVHPSDEVIRYLNLYGPTNPHLYPLVLRYLSSSPDVLSRHSEQLAEILQTIDEERIMPPLAVVQLLSRNGVTSVGSVKDWLRQKTEDTRDDIEAVSRGFFKPRNVVADSAAGPQSHPVVSNRDDEQGKGDQGPVGCHVARSLPGDALRVVRWSARPAQRALYVQAFVPSEVCDACDGMLLSTDLCRCLSDSDPECVLCARQHSIIREVRRNQTRLADRHDLFVGEVHDADDGFSVVAGAFSRGVMGSKATTA